MNLSVTLFLWITLNIYGIFAEVCKPKDLDPFDTKIYGNIEARSYCKTYDEIQCIDDELCELINPENDDIAQKIQENNAKWGNFVFFKFGSKFKGNTDYETRNLLVYHAEIIFVTDENPGNEEDKWIWHRIDDKHELTNNLIHLESSYFKQSKEDKPKIFQFYPNPGWIGYCDSTQKINITPYQNGYIAAKNLKQET